MTAPAALAVDNTAQKEAPQIGIIEQIEQMIAEAKLEDLQQLNGSLNGKLKTVHDRRIKELEKARRDAARDTLEEMAAEMGFSLKELVNDSPASSGSKPKKTAPPKYRNPNDASQTWTGRGRTPQWIKDLEAAGKSRDDALI